MLARKSRSQTSKSWAQRNSTRLVSMVSTVKMRLDTPRPWARRTGPREPARWRVRRSGAVRVWGGGGGGEGGGGPGGGGGRGGGGGAGRPGGGGGGAGGRGG